MDSTNRESQWRNRMTKKKKKKANRNSAVGKQKNWNEKLTKGTY